MKERPVTGEEIRRLVGDIDDDKVYAILAIAPCREELEAALGWAGGETEVMSETGQHAAGKVARILEILSSDDEWEEDREPEG